MSKTFNVTGAAGNSNVENVNVAGTVEGGMGNTSSGKYRVDYSPTFNVL